MATPDLVKKILSEQDSSIDLSGGTAGQDILVNAPGYVLDYTVQEMQKLEAERDLTDVVDLPDSKLDRVGNQLFVPRQEGIKATGTVRLYFRLPVSKTVDAGVVFQTTDGLNFVNKASQSITAAEMALNIEGNYCFMDLTSIEAEKAGSIYSIQPYEIVRVVGGYQDLVKVTNIQAFSVGSDPMDNSQYIRAIQNGISIRDLVVENSIVTVLSQQFPQYPLYYVAGYRDQEMERDYVYGMEIGGCVDIYPKVFSSLSYTSNLSPAVNLTYQGNPLVFIRTYSINSDTGEDYSLNTIAGLPISKILTVERRAQDGSYTSLSPASYLDPAPSSGAYFLRIPLGPKNVGIVGLPPNAAEFWNPKQYFKYGGLAQLPQFNPYPDNSCLMHSIYEESILVFVKNDGTYYGAADTFRITYNGVDPSVARAIQTYVDDKTRKTIDADHLVRAMVPFNVDITVNVVTASTAPLVSALNSLINNAETYDDITMAKIISTLISAGADTVDLPVSVNYSCNLPSGKFYSAASLSNGKLDIIGVKSLYKYIGYNIRFTPGTITVNSVQA